MLLKPLVAIPVKPFGVAKARLAPLLTPEERSRLGKAVAAHTARVADESGGHVAIVTASPAVASWAHGLGLDTIDDPGSGLDAAAAAAVARAGKTATPWLVLHADLPLLTVSDVAALIDALAASSAVLAPSHDAGTAALGARAAFSRFGYGPGSYHRHRRALPTAAVVIRPGLAIDLDTTKDLSRILAMPAGRWVAELASP